MLVGNVREQIRYRSAVGQDRFRRIGTEHVFQHSKCKHTDADHREKHIVFRLDAGWL